MSTNFVCVCDILFVKNCYAAKTRRLTNIKYDSSLLDPTSIGMNNYYERVNAISFESLNR